MLVQILQMYTYFVEFMINIVIMIFNVFKLEQEKFMVLHQVCFITVPQNIYGHQFELSHMCNLNEPRKKADLYHVNFFLLSKQYEYYGLSLADIIYNFLSTIDMVKFFKAISSSLHLQIRFCTVKAVYNGQSMEKHKVAFVGR